MGIWESMERMGRVGQIHEIRERNRRLVFEWNRNVLNALWHQGQGILDLVEFTGLGRLKWERKQDGEGMGNGLNRVGGCRLRED